MLLISHYLHHHWKLNKNLSFIIFPIKLHEREGSLRQLYAHLHNPPAFALRPRLDREILWTSNLAKGIGITHLHPWICFRVVCMFCVSCLRCYSFVGRRGRGQIVSLSRGGCVFQQIVQHEMLHALGFNHEQTRSDRDEHVRIILNNVIPGGYLRMQFHQYHYHEHTRLLMVSSDSLATFF